MKNVSVWFVTFKTKLRRLNINQSNSRRGSGHMTVGFQVRRVGVCSPTHLCRRTTVLLERDTIKGRNAAAAPPPVFLDGEIVLFCSVKAGNGLLLTQHFSIKA